MFRTAEIPPADLVAGLADEVLGLDDHDAVLLLKGRVGRDEGLVGRRERRELGAALILGERRARWSGLCLPG